MFTFLVLGRLTTKGGWKSIQSDSSYLTYLMSNEELSFWPADETEIGLKTILTRESFSPQCWGTCQAISFKSTNKVT